MSDEVLQRARERFEEINKDALEDFRRAKEVFNRAFEDAWEHKHCKWFLKKWRRKRLRVKMWRAHSYIVFPLIEDIVKTTLIDHLKYGDYFQGFVDIKDLSVGTKAGYNAQVIIDELKNEQGGGLYLYGENKIRNHSAAEQAARSDQGASLPI